MPRTFKQIAYGILFLMIIGGVGYGVYYFWIGPAPSCFDNRQNQNETGIDCGGGCISCEIKALKPLVVSEPVLLRSDDLVSFGFLIENQNMHYGVEEFSYVINVYDSNNKIINSLNRNSFIYAGEKKVIVEAGIQDTQHAIQEADIVLDTDVVWQSASEWFPPAVDMSNVVTATSTEQGSHIAMVTGKIKNPNNFPIKKVILSALAVDKTGIKIGFSKTELENITPFEEREFRIFIGIASDVFGQLDLKATLVNASAQK